MKFVDEDIRYFIYLDESGIDSIYRQYSDAGVELRQTDISHVEGALGSKISSNSILSKIFNADISADIKANQDTKQEYNIEISYEDKVKFIHNKINGGKTILLPDYLHKCPHISFEVIVCKAIFRLEQAINDKNGEYIMPSELRLNPYAHNELSFVFASSPSIACTSGEESLLSISEKNDEYYVDMYFSGSKLVRNVRHLTTNLKYGKDFIFHILGEIKYLGNKIYNIIPYAIWRQTDKNM